MRKKTYAIVLPETVAESVGKLGEDNCSRKEKGKGH
jgi:hypothetical protein